MDQFVPIRKVTKSLSFLDTFSVLRLTRPKLCQSVAMLHSYTQDLFLQVASQGSEWYEDTAPLKTEMS